MPLRAYLLLVLALTNSAWHACASEPVELPAVRKPHLDAWRGSTPTLDGVLSPGEYDDATHIHGVKGWVAQFSPTRVAADLSLEGFVKHDGQQLYFAFRITDDLPYGIDTPRWLPANNPLAHELSQKGFPWFGDEMEILLNASNRWMADESVAGDGGSWQMVCNLTKSRLGGVGVGGLLEGEPRSSDAAWRTYQRWILDGQQRCEAKPLAAGAGYVIEWAVRLQPCVEIAPGRFWTPALGHHTVGLNLALGDLDRPEDGAGNFANFHHEDWWAGARGVRTQLRYFGTLTLQPGTRPALPAPAPDHQR
jgi:SSS family solute:Na+ symporter